MLGQGVTPGSYRVSEQAPRPSLLGANAHVNESARLYTDPFSVQQDVKGGGNPLYKSLAGRLLTQSVARGLFGAAFFTAGCYTLKVWKPGVDIAEQHILGKAPEALSRFFDTVLTAPIQAAIGHFTSPQEAEELMRFNKFMAKPHVVKEAMAPGAPEFKNAKVFGLTYGQEMVNRTWQFASGSIGAALGRNMVMALDPNFKKSWLHDDGIDWGDFAKSSLKQAWKIFSYDQMEDWFAAPFYTVQLRLERSLYHNGVTADSAKNAAMWSLQNDGNCVAERLDPKGEGAQMQGSLQGTGARDLHDRFTKYNFYTLLYRDLYNHLAHTFTTLREHGGPEQVKLPEKPLEALTHGVAESAKYLTKSFIKSQIYMFPAVLTFWPQRVSISRASHSMVDDKTGQLITTVPTRSFNVNDPTQKFLENGVPVPHMEIAARPHDIREGNTLYSNADAFRIYDLNYNPYANGKGAFDKALAPLGKGANAYATWLDESVAQPAAAALSQHTGIEADRAHLEASWLANNFAATQLAYTGYMEAKYETAQLWDTPVMDAAAYRFTDGMFGLNFKEAWEGVKDIARVITLQPVSEETAQHVGEPRGPVNSRYEARCRADEKQTALRVEQEIEEVADLVKQEGIILPTAKVEEIKHQGAAAAIELQKQEEKSTLAANAIQPFKRKRAEREVVLDLPGLVVGERALNPERLRNDRQKVEALI